MADMDCVREARQPRTVELEPTTHRLDPRPFALGLVRIAAAVLEEDGELNHLNRAWLDRHLYAPAPRGTISPEVEEPEWKIFK